MARPGPWLTQRPAEVIVGGAIVLRRWSAGDVLDLVEATNETIEELRPWMPWAQEPATETSVTAALEKAGPAWDGGREFAFTIRSCDTGRLIGSCGLHDRLGPGSLEIGYWVRRGHTGRGVATAAAGLLTRTALELDGVTRVEIHCDEANSRSAAVPRKLGFRLDRIEARPAETPGETDRRMIWVTTGGGLTEETRPGSG